MKGCDYAEDLWLGQNGPQALADDDCQSLNQFIKIFLLLSENAGNYSRRINPAASFSGVQV